MIRWLGTISGCCANGLGWGCGGDPVGGGGGREGVRTSAVAEGLRAMGATKSHFTGKQLDVVTVG